MRRTGAAILAAALAITMTLAHEPRRLAGSPAARAASACTWKRHSKRVVRRVKRHGRVRRVRRTRHWWTCVAPPPQPSTAAPAPAPPSGGEPQPEIAHLGVKSQEWTYTLSRPEVQAGEVAVELNNQGEDPHDLNLLREGDEGPPLSIPVTASLQRTTKRFTLPAGTYRLWCDLPEHDELGMHATLVVGGG
ncbi:MAG TPA: hypothetical protein VGF04_09110 [Solirubrobacterales bacterium]